MHAADQSEHATSSAGVDVLRQWVEAYNVRDMEALLALSDDDCELRPYLATMIERSAYHGHAGIREYFSDADAAWERIQVMLNDDFEVAGEHLVGSVEIYGKARASGLEVRVPVTWVADIRDGVVRRVHAFTTRAQALAAVD